MKDLSPIYNEEKLVHYANLKTLSQEDLSKELEKACDKNDAEKVKYLLESKELYIRPNINGAESTKEYDEHPIIKICTIGNLELLDYILTLPSLKVKFKNLEDQLSRGLVRACEKNHLELIKYILTSPRIETHANINYRDDEALSWACTYGNLEVVKYLLTSPELKKHADINCRNGEPIFEACWHNHMHVVSYLLTSPELQEHADVHINTDFVTISAITGENLELIKFLIFDVKIKQTENIKSVLEKVKNQTIIDWFKLRDLNNSLENELDKKEENIIRKIKL
jgi:ankyrin repeat protein